jgi:hypothetical protein
MVFYRIFFKGCCPGTAPAGRRRGLRGGLLPAGILSIFYFCGVVPGAEGKDFRPLMTAQYNPYPYSHPYPPPAYGPPPDSNGSSLQVRASGWVHILVDPPDAEVYLDGIKMDRGEDNAFEEGALTGRHKVEVKKEGYHDYVAYVMVHQAVKERLKVSLRKIGAPKPAPPVEASGMPPAPPGARPPEPYGAPGQAQPWGWIRVEITPPGARVFLNGNPMGAVEKADFEERVMPGRHKVEVKKEGYQDYVIYVDAQPGVKERLKINLKKVAAKKSPKEPRGPAEPGGPGLAEPFPFK